MKEQFACIYLIKNIINNKIYVGKTRNFTKRMNKHRSDANRHSKNKQVISRAISKYGWENFEISILEKFEINIDECLLIEKEALWINKLNSAKKDIGYNVEKIGMPSSYNKRKPFSEETKFKISQSRKELYRTGKITSPFADKEFLKKIRKDKLEINQFDLKTKQLIKTWPSAADAANFLGFKSSQGINSTCRKERNQTFGFYWEYVKPIYGIPDFVPREIKKVKQIDTHTGEVIFIFNSCEEAAKSIGYRHGSNISTACRIKIHKTGNRPIVAGYHWEFVI